MTGRRPAGRAVQDGAVVDAAELTLSWTDPAAQWGLGVFETLAARDRAPVWWSEHWSRLVRAAAALSVPLPAATAAELAVRLVADGIADGAGWVKILVSRSGRWTVFGGPLDAASIGRPVSAVLLEARRHSLDPLTGVKSLAYAASLLGLEEAHRRGADEGLWRNERGHVVEACTANVFAVRGRAVVTPAVHEGARDGVTRSWAIGVLRELGLSVHVSKIRVATLKRADEIFLTGSLSGVRSVVRIDGRDVRGGSAGPITKRLMERFGAVAPEAAMSDGDGPRE